MFGGRVHCLLSHPWFTTQEQYPTHVFQVLITDRRLYAKKVCQVVAPRDGWRFTENTSVYTLLIGAELLSHEVKCQMSPEEQCFFSCLSTLRESFLGEVVLGHFQEASEPFLIEW